MITFKLVLLALMVIPFLLGTVVIARILYGIVRALVSKAVSARRPQRGTDTPPVPLLDQPTACPVCNRMDLVNVARGDFKELPFVEHFICRACGAQYLGPNQEATVVKRLEAKRKLQDLLAGRAPKA